jgi:hypothetical protein
MKLTCLFALVALATAMSELPVCVYDCPGTDKFLEAMQEAVTPPYGTEEDILGALCVLAGNIGHRGHGCMADCTHETKETFDMVGQMCAGEETQTHVPIEDCSVCTSCIHHFIHHYDCGIETVMADGEFMAECGNCGHFCSDMVNMNTCKLSELGQGLQAFDENLGDVLPDNIDLSSFDSFDISEGSFADFGSFAAFEEKQTEAVVTSAPKRTGSIVYASMTGAVVAVGALAVAAMRYRATAAAPSPLGVSAGDSFL